MTQSTFERSLLVRRINSPFWLALLGVVFANLIAFLLESRLPLLTFAAMLGFWYGTRTRLQAYVGGLLRAVNPEDRKAIVDLAYERLESRGLEQAQRRSGSAK